MVQSIFPNYTETMYLGNEPTYYIDYVNNKKGSHYQNEQGHMNLTPDNEIWSAQFSLDTNNTIYIVGNHIKLIHIPYDGIPHYWQWTNDERFYEHGKKCLPKYPKDYINKLIIK